MPVRGPRVEIRHYRDDGSLDCLIGGLGFPQGAGDRVRYRVRARLESRDSPALNDIAVDELRRAAERRGLHVVRISGRGAGG